MSASSRSLNFLPSAAGESRNDPNADDRRRGATRVGCAGRSRSVNPYPQVDSLGYLEAIQSRRPKPRPERAVAVGCIPAMSVVEVDSVPVPPPLSESQIEAMVARLGDEGLSAISNFLEAHDERAMPNRVDNLGNLPGTPT